MALPFDWNCVWTEGELLKLSESSDREERSEVRLACGSVRMADRWSGDGTGAREAGGRSSAPQSVRAGEFVDGFEGWTERAGVFLWLGSHRLID